MLRCRALLGIAQLIMLGELAVNRALDNLQLPGRCGCRDHLVIDRVFILALSRASSLPRGDADC